MANPDGTSSIQRGDPEIDHARKARVIELIEMVKGDQKHWEYAFKRMRAWREFARGLQWPGSTKEDLGDPDRLYTANITLRHLRMTTAAVYAKNPSYQWRRTPRILNTVWDGTAQHYQMALQIVNANADQTGVMAKVIQDVAANRHEAELYDRMGKTLVALYEYYLREQNPPMKKMAKKQVLAAFTVGVAYIKQTFQRKMDLPPDVSRQIADHLTAIKRLEQLAADLEDDDFGENEAKMEELRTLVASLEATPQIVLREGLVLDYPDSTSIIPDRNMTYLPGFVGCGHVTEEFCLTPDEIKQVYGKDVAGHFTEYTERDPGPKKAGTTQRTTARVWEIWDRDRNQVMTVCDGYPDYLVEPQEPVTYTERFYPWFVFAPNALDDSEDPFPPSDVELMAPMQMEINRAGEGLRDHRYAARPGHVTGANVDAEDAAKISGRKAHQIVTLKGLMPEEDIKKKFQEFPTSAIDPNLYQTSPAFTDVMRTVGAQEANLGGTAGVTATESSIAESSRQSTTSSAVDELDDMLTEMARAGGQICLAEVSEETVKKIVGRGAVWPTTSRQDVAEEIHLEVIAGSSGKANQAVELAVMERAFPLLYQLPGLSHEKMARHGLSVLDPGARYEDWVDTSALSLMALNGQFQAAANNGGGGGANAPAPPGSSGTGQPGAGQDGATAAVRQPGNQPNPGNSASAEPSARPPMI